MIHNVRFLFPGVLVGFLKFLGLEAGFQLISDNFRGIFLPSIYKMSNNDLILIEMNSFYARVAYYLKAVIKFSFP